jgi:hypothetical protein
VKKNNVLNKNVNGKLKKNMEFNFEVAFSFLKEDLSFAYDIKNKLSVNIRTFIYADKQEVLAGKDGPAIFTSVFKKETRLVVILYRKQYGETQYTSVEKDAISARALETKWDFVIFIPFEKPIPDWYPYTYSYIDPISNNVDQIASIIEYKLRELGAEIEQETLIEKAKRIQRNKKNEEERINILRSPDSFHDANKLFDTFHMTLEIKSSELNELIGLTFHYNHIKYNEYRQTYLFHKVNNSANDSYLNVLTEKMSSNSYNYKVISNLKIKLNLNESRKLGWYYESSILDSESLVDKLINKLIDLK